ncbi:GL15260 [Drosophila persimilis]|uniref:GL15260 n=1 Tax=Drosophila persimilis TaxID=7234 RepID=B4H3W9_DROPE|nr:GL15260 [Drosophila persimilis]
MYFSSGDQPAASQQQQQQDTKAHQFEDYSILSSASSAHQFLSFAFDSSFSFSFWILASGNPHHHPSQPMGPTHCDSKWTQSASDCQEQEQRKQPQSQQPLQEETEELAS